MSRKLASIQRVWKVEDIEGADRLQKASVLGWTCVVNKGTFKPYDLGVYFEIDSFLPIRPEFEFLRGNSYKKTDVMGEGFRLKTMKFRGQISQGLLLPLSTFPELKDMPLNKDVTEILGVKKWEIEEKVTTGGTAIGNLPTSIPHSDEVRCFIGKTKILTDNGLLYISDIVNKKIKCKVLTYNEAGNIVEWNEIAKYYKHKEYAETCTITYPFKYNENRTNSLTATTDHKIFTNKGWIELKDVDVGDEIYIPTLSYSDEVIQFVAGMLLGDSHMNAENRTQKNGSIYKKRHISFTQGEKQLSYLKEKLRILGCKSKIREGKSGYCDNKVYQTSLRVDDMIEEWFNSLFGDSKKKVITRDYLKFITPVSVAFWYMDDGSLLSYKDGRDWQDQIRIHTEAYTKEENELFVERFKELGVIANIYTEKSHGKIYYYLHFSVEESKKFQDMIAKYIFPDMRYKLSEKYIGEEYAFRDFTLEKSDRLIPVTVLSKTMNVAHRAAPALSLYNIETVPNHNYFANRVLVHNCQAEPLLIDEFKGLEYYISTKMDGSSHSISWDENGFHVTGHNYEYKDDGKCAFWEFVKSKNLPANLHQLKENRGFKTITVQGELCAPGIQSNRLKLTKPAWYVFTVMEDGKRVGLDEMLYICKFLGVDHVPIEEVDKDLPSKYPTVEALLERADGEYPRGGKKEGIVIRPTEPVYCPLISAPLSMKVVSNKYLLKNEE